MGKVAGQEVSEARAEILGRLREQEGSHHVISQNNNDGSGDAIPDKQSCITRFIAGTEKSGAGLTVLPDYEALPKAISGYLEEKNLPKKIYLSDYSLKELDWGDGLEVNFGPFDKDCEVGLVEAYAGIAETGTIASLSNRTLATAALFLPHYSLIVLNTERIKARLEDVWYLIQEEQVPLPRTINLITGPSRTGDIEQTIQIGAHGPCELQLFLVNCPSLFKTGGAVSGKEEKGSG